MLVLTHYHCFAMLGRHALTEGPENHIPQVRKRPGSARLPDASRRHLPTCIRSLNTPP